MHLKISIQQLTCQVLSCNLLIHFKFSKYDAKVCMSLVLHCPAYTILFPKPIESVHFYSFLIFKLFTSCKRFIYKARLKNNRQNVLQNFVCCQKTYMQFDLGMQAKLFACWWISLVVFKHRMQNNWLSFEHTYYEKSGYLVNRFCAG